MSHHGRNPFEGNDILRKLFQEDRKSSGDPLKDLQRTLQGEFPDGRLNPNDEGAMAGLTAARRQTVGLDRVVSRRRERKP